MILTKNTKFLNLTKDDQEGVTYISLTPQSSVLLGRALASTNNFKFNTVIGPVRTISGFMQCISTKDFPKDLLLKSRYKEKDIKLISSLTTLNLVNYWAAMAYATCSRVQQDEELVKWLKGVDIPFTIVRWEKGSGSLSDQEYLVNVTRLRVYLAIVRDITALIKADDFNDVSIEELINFYKDDKEAHVFEGADLIYR